MNDRDSALYQNANTYRIHQDTLRWSLLAGWAAFFTATIALLGGEKISNSKPLFCSLSVVLFLVGNAYLLVLAVENWFYNLFADYVRECEERLIKDTRLRALAEFGHEKGRSIDPFHPSFFFVLLLVVLGNSLYLFQLISGVVQTRGAQIVIMLLFTICYFSFCHWVLRRWNSTIYKRVIEPLQHLYKKS
jgi:hypothetical protein